MSDEIIKILDDLSQRFGIAIDWSSENVVPYLQDLIKRYVAYEVATSILWMVLSVIVLGVGIGFMAWMIKIKDTDLMILPVILAIIGVALVITQVIDIIEVSTIPEKMIYEYLSSSIS